ncbi:MAG TPA: mevalonate kinase [Anaerolineaceae bacterium]|nr:mevalonate kinase [Anaerolineaceae bacterium]
MPAISATAPGKCILFGEHAAVYSRPALAVPVFQVRARVMAMANITGKPGTVHIQAPDVGLESELDQLPGDHPLSIAAHGVMAALSIDRSLAVTLRITSTIPLAAGLGSGAAVSVALIRAFSAFLGHSLPAEQVNSLAYEVEKRLHGTPSGIDNTVITYGQPVYFIKGQPPRLFQVPVPFTLVVADTGVRSPTAKAVGDVRAAWEAEPDRYNPIFDRIGVLAHHALDCIQQGHPEEMGPLMDANQVLLQQMGVSSPDLERLVEAARTAGALGAKLSGGGGGGITIALVNPASAPTIIAALQSAGAAQVFSTRVQ